MLSFNRFLYVRGYALISKQQSNNNDSLYIYIYVGQLPDKLIVILNKNVLSCQNKNKSVYVNYIIIAYLYLRVKSALIES